MEKQNPSPTQKPPLLGLAIFESKYIGESVAECNFGSLKDPLLPEGKVEGAINELHYVADNGKDPEDKDYSYCVGKVACIGGQWRIITPEMNLDENLDMKNMVNGHPIPQESMKQISLVVGKPMNVNFPHMKVRSIYVMHTNSEVENLLDRALCRHLRLGVKVKFFNALQGERAKRAAAERAAQLEQLAA